LIVSQPRGSHAEAGAQQVLQQGLAARDTTATAANESSSRSHMLVTIEQRTFSTRDSVTKECCGRMHFADLAGSERLSSATDSQQTASGKLINSSLSMLTGAIRDRALKTKDPIYRDCALTKLLRVRRF
jgi:Kinesin motor domain